MATTGVPTPTVSLIPVDQIRVLNPRARNPTVFADIVENIRLVGLKRPVTVTPTGAGYDLVCGQGRLEAFKALGEAEIPALVIETSERDGLLMSLVENLARRKHTNLELLDGLRLLAARGDTPALIARKTGLDARWVRDVVHLLKTGEERLIAAVEAGRLPLRLAVKISRSTEADLQRALVDAYETGALRGHQLIRVRRLVNQRQVLGKRFGSRPKTPGRPVAVRKLVQAHQDEVERRTRLVAQHAVTEKRLLILVSFLQHVLADEHVRTLLRAEGLADLPHLLAERVSP